MQSIGDFLVSQFEKQFASDKNKSRSEREREIDRDNRAPVTTDVDAWAKNPDRLDYPGVDTPSREPGVLPKDLKHPAKTKLSSKKRGRSRSRELPSEERNTSAPEPETARLAAQDVSLSPEEAFEGVATGSFESSPTPGVEKQLARGPAADIAFIESEQERSKPDDELSLL